MNIDLGKTRMVRAISGIDPRTSIFIGVAAVLTLIKLWLVAAQILQALGDYVYDDLLFISHAMSILSGNWLGPYTETTLVKGFFYPLWLTIVSSTGVPLQLAQHLLYIVACVAMVAALRPVMGRGALLTLYIVLLFNPISFDGEVASRVLRDHIYSSLTLLVVAGATGILTRCVDSMAKLAFWAVVLGFALAMVSLTREEGVWILPLIMLIGSAAVWRIYAGKSMMWQRFALCLLPGMIWLFALGLVAGLNKHYYGLFTTVDVRSPGFLAAYGALTRVKPDQWQPTVPVPEHVRERIYGVSPAFSELRQYLEGERGAGWKGRGWRFEGRFSHWDWNDDSFDIHGGVFFWALRDAVALAGHYASAPGAEDFYWRIANEVNGACRDGRLACGPERATVVPVWHAEYNAPLLSTFLRAFGFTVGFEGFNSRPFLSRGSTGNLRQFADFTHEELFLAARGQMNLRGWVFSPGKKVHLAVSQPGGRIAPAEIRYGHSPYVYQRFLDRGMDIPEAREARFELTTPCLSGCFLEVRADGDGHLIGRAPLDAGIRSTYTPELYFGIDSVDPGSTGFSPSQTALFEPKLDALQAIGRIYQLLMPWMFAVAAIAYIVFSARLLRQRTIDALWIVVTALVGSVVARVLMVAIIDLISFPAIRTLYLAAAYPLLLSFTVIMLAKACQPYMRTRAKTVAMT